MVDRTGPGTADLHGRWRRAHWGLSISTFQASSDTGKTRGEREDDGELTKTKNGGGSRPTTMHGVGWQTASSYKGLASVCKQKRVRKRGKTGLATSQSQREARRPAYSGKETMDDGDCDGRSSSVSDKIQMRVADVSSGRNSGLV